MKTISLDVHADASQVTVVSREGEVIFEMKTPTRREELRSVIGGVAGPKRVVFEEGPLSGSLHDWLEDLCEEIISCDPAHNALIARSEDASDERDARRLAQLAQLGSTRPVYIAPEPYRTLRSLQQHDERAQRSIVAVKNRIGGLCRRHAIASGRAVYWHAARERVLAALPNGALRWQMESLYRQLDLLRRERVGAHRVLHQWTRKLPIVQRLDTLPGVGPITACTLVAWILRPESLHPLRSAQFLLRPRPWPGMDQLEARRTSTRVETRKPSRQARPVLGGHRGVAHGQRLGPTLPSTPPERMGPSQGDTRRGARPAAVRLGHVEERNQL